MSEKLFNEILELIDTIDQRVDTIHALCKDTVSDFKTVQELSQNLLDEIEKKCGGKEE
ncbi:MAG: hypothetical protein JJE19_07015 [Methanosarcinales archaeon]|nr:hypothetical protein [Methanosarcinales archaeon]